jgi:hypothetical protein
MLLDRIEKGHGPHQRSSPASGCRISGLAHFIRRSLACGSIGDDEAVGWA